MNYVLKSFFFSIMLLMFIYCILAYLKALRFYYPCIGVNRNGTGVKGGNGERIPADHRPQGNAYLIFYSTRS